MTGVLEDLRYGVRALAKNRGFGAAAVLSLALGIGANTTIFTLVNAVLLRPLPGVREPGRMATVYTLDPRNPGYLYCSYPNYKDYRDRNQVFSSLLLYTGLNLNVSGSGEPQMITGQMVTGNYFAALGVNPVIGRGFLPDEDTNPGSHPVAVISYRFWQRQFAGDPRVTGRTMVVNGRTFRIVGVAPEGFEGLDTLSATDVWVPMMMYPQVFPNAAWVNQRRALVFVVAGRLRPGVSLRQAEAGMQVVARDLEREYPRENRGRRLKLVPVTEAAIPPQNRPEISNAGLVLLVVSALVLLIACANVAGLLLARGSARGKEIAVRLAMGASRWRLIRQLLIESVLLGLAGGVVGLGLARFARDVLWAMRPPMFTYAAIHLGLDGRVLGYTAAVSILTGILFGLVPAFRATRSDLATDLKERAGRGAHAGRGWTRSALVAAQVALSVVALVGAGLFIRSLRDAGRMDPGFDAAHTGIVLFNVGEQGYSEERGREFQRRAVAEAASVPGVISASLARDWPFQVSLRRTVLLEGREDTVHDTNRRALLEMAWPGFLRTVGIPILRGRDFAALDSAAGPRVAIVNQAAAMHFWPGEDPVGKRIRFFGDTAPVEVVGLARDANYLELGEPPQAMIYVSLVQYYFPQAVVYVRTSGDPDAVLPVVRRKVQALDRNLLLQHESTAGIIREALWSQRLSALLLGAFGGLALVLAAVGVYGVISYSVNQRLREIGVRMAMGATPAEVQISVLRDGLRLAAIGIAAGLAIAAVCSRAVAGMLFVIGPRDALTFTLVPAALVLVTVVACWLPARRATRVDPATALREE
jgi:macrolide transport system ATP-binding/permease protein